MSTGYRMDIKDVWDPRTDSEWCKDTIGFLEELVGCKEDLREYIAAIELPLASLILSFNSHLHVMNPVKPFHIVRRQPT